MRRELTEADIEAGEALVRRLDDRDWPVTAALWFHLADSEQWKLVLASPTVDRDGARQGYFVIRRAIRDEGQDSLAIDLADISLLPSSHDLIQLLDGALRYDGDFGRIRFTQNVVNGVLIDDALIYRLQSPTTLRDAS